MWKWVRAIEPWSSQVRRAFIVFAVVLLSFPAPIQVLRSSFDDSWMAGINWATAHQRVFGRDVIFTYGPLGFALFPVDCSTETWRLIAVVAHLVLFLFWWLSVGLVLAHIDDLEGELLFAAGSLIASGSLDGGGILTLTLLGYLAVSLSRDSLALGLLGAVWAGAALFIKFNLGVAYIATVLVWVAIFAGREPWKSAAKKGAATLATLAATIAAVFWAVGGGPRDFGEFIWYSADIAEAYSSQMSIPGPLWPAIYLLGVLGVMAIYAASGAILGWKSWSIAAIMILPIFLEYKRGVVRMDWSHWAQAVLNVAVMPAFLMVASAEKGERERIRWMAVTILFTGLVTTISSWTTMATAGLVGLVLLAIFARAMRFSWCTRALTRLTALVAGAALVMMIAALGVVVGSMAVPRYPASIRLPRGPKNVVRLLHLKSWLATTPEQPAPASLESELSPADLIQVPQTMIGVIGQGPLDVYPYEGARALIHGMNYSPRFIFQSYQAYTPPLDLRSADHFRGPGSPRFILYSHFAIDEGHPCLVDPQTWLEIYRSYNVDLEDPSGYFLLLERRETPRWHEGNRVLGESRIELGERWEVPKGVTAPLLLKARLDLTAAGKLVRFFYRVMPPTIRIEYDDGKVVDHRLAWLNARSGFLVSDLPRDNAAVKSFFERGVGNRVRAVTFLADTPYFARQIQLQWEELPVGPGTVLPRETIPKKGT